MPTLATVVDLRNALFVRAQPAITRWNRLEGRPRTHHFDRALRAEVRDPLWMLSRQWQMGEFKGDDAGSPVMARIASSVSAFDAYQPDDGPVGVFPRDIPLEAQVERRPIAWRAGAQKLALDLRVAIGRRWLKLIARDLAAGRLTADYSTAYRTNYAIAAPDPASVADAAVCAHPDAWRQVSALAGRAMDGYALIEHLDTPGSNAHDGIGAAPGDEARLAELAAALRAWVGRLVMQPETEAVDAWAPRKLEYQFACSAPLGGGADFVARAEEYYHGHLDWYVLERADAKSLGEAPSGGPAPSLSAHSFIPVGLVFSGMPNTRWWEFEDRRTNLAQVKPDTTDLGKLLLLDFAFLYANDWFVFPHTLPIGSVAAIKGVAITNVFGERIWVEAANERPSSDWQRWSMFQLTSAKPSEPMLVLPPAAVRVLQSAPIEEVALVRDEMANMVWGIERRVPLPTGTAKPGGEAAREYFAQLERIIGAPPPPPPARAPIRYQVMNTVPEHWIPFVPVHVAGAEREIELQRAALPRLLGPDPANFERVRPRTMLMRAGLDTVPETQRYYIDEEEVPRAGALVKQTYQRTRWLNGAVFVWAGVTKSVGRGESSSGLAFDQLVDAQSR